MTPTSTEQPTRPLRRDWLLVGGLLLVTVLPYALSGREALTLVGAVATGALAWRRAHPVPIFLVVAVATLAQVPFSENLQAFDVALMVALYAVVEWVSDRRQLLLVGTICFLGALIAGWDWDASQSSGTVTTSAVALLAVGCLTVSAAVAALGLAARRRRELLVELHGRAVDAERERDQQARLAAQTERTRIAREMHDVVAHALAVIVVQADGASYVVRHAGAPASAAEALDAIGSTSRGALAETRRLVSALREEDETAGLAPSVQAQDIPALVGRVRDAGLDVQLRAQFDLGEVPPAAGAAAYRVVQEALTNVIKHGGDGATASVSLRRRDGVLQVRVVDTGRGVLPGADHHSGYGLVGMRERVTVLDGRLTTGPEPGGGFAVEAEIPCENGPHDDRD